MTQLENMQHVLGPRVSSHIGHWAPLYLEPIPGSGERVCIGVAAADTNDTTVVPVSNLFRFNCVYGNAAETLTWAAELAISEALHQIRSGGLASLAELPQRFEGLSVGHERRGAGTGLLDLAHLALSQVSSLVAFEPSKLPSSAMQVSDYETPHRLDSKIRRLVSGRRPELSDKFGRAFRRSQSSRPLRYGFVGRHIAANFATLNAISTNTVGPQVDRAKARLWDLHQLDAGVLADSLPLHPESITYELLVHRPRPQDSSTTAPLRKSLREAEEELEAEADKFQIRFRPLTSPEEIADYLVQREAA